MDIGRHSCVIRQFVVAGTVLLILGCTRCYSAPFYGDGFSVKTSYNCSLDWCGEIWKKNRIIRYNYTAVRRLAYKTISVAQQNVDCSYASNSLDCTDQDAETTASVQIPEVALEWNRTAAEVQVLSQELALGIIKTDNIDFWGRATSAYPANMDKVWQLSVPQPGCNMIVHFHEFDMERSLNCEEDYFSIQTSKGQLDIPRYCNGLSRIELRRTKRVQLWVHSGNSTRRNGVYGIYCFNHWPLGSADLPCNCDGRSLRNKRKIFDVNATNMTEAEHSVLTTKVCTHVAAIVGGGYCLLHLQYLRDMFTFGQDGVAAYLNSGNRLQRHLASKLLEAINWL